MPKKPLLYPHVTMSRPKKGTNAWRCRQCGWTTWNISYCPKCGSRDLEELSSEEMLRLERGGQIHSRSETQSAKLDKWDVAMFEEWLRLAREKGTDVIKVRLAEDFGAKPGWVRYTVEVSAKEVKP